MAADPDQPGRIDRVGRPADRVHIFSTCPESRGVELSAYRDVVRTASRASEGAGCFGMLIYAENRLVDPWLVAQIVIDATDHLVPLIAVQPAYSHPYTVAKLVSTLTNVSGRQVHINLVAGGFRNDLLALGDRTEHDDRYLRLGEFSHIVASLCHGEAVNFDGRFYTVQGLRLIPPVPPELRPEFTVAGSSPAGRELAHALDATAVRYPLPPGEEDEIPRESRTGIRVGIIARADRHEAWRVAHETFPPDRSGEVAHGFAAKASDSHWYRRLSSHDDGAPSAQTPYWLSPFLHYQSFCPYLVGSYAEVAAEVGRYVDDGATTVILDIPSREEELWHGLRSVRLAAD